jgi:ABC-type phosphate/phosphonate transport system permease subunit
VSLPQIAMIVCIVTFVPRFSIPLATGLIDSFIHTIQYLGKSRS